MNQSITCEDIDIYDGYTCYVTMMNRCYDKNCAAYSKYGAVGITVCRQWIGKNGFAQFIKDMGIRPAREYSIDRIDGKGNYEPSNCRWATRHVQAANRKDNTKQPGVCYNAKTCRWQAYMIVDRRRVLSKTFKTEEEAVKARREAELEHLGYCTRP